MSDDMGALSDQAYKEREFERWLARDQVRADGRLRSQLRRAFMQGTYAGYFRERWRWESGGLVRPTVADRRE